MEIKCVKHEVGGCRFYAFVTVKTKDGMKRTGERFKVHAEGPPDFKKVKSEFAKAKVAVAEADLKAAYDAA